MHAPSITRALLLAASLSSGLSAQSARDKEREAPEVSSLAFKGVEHFDARDITATLSTQATKCRSLLIKPFCLISHTSTFEEKHYFDRDEMRRDMLRIRLFYYKHGYRETEVDTTVTRTGSHHVAVTFTVREGRPTLIRTLAIDRDTLIADRIRNRLTLLHPNDPLDLIVLDSMRVLFQNELWDRGFGDGVADTTIAVDTATRLADVALHLTPGRRTTVGNITIAGNRRVDQRTIRNAITFRPGDLYRQTDVLESQRNLYESNLFRLAAIYVGPQPDSVKNVNIDVTEAPLHEARLGPGLNNVDFGQFQVHYTSYNIFGGARRLDIDLNAGNLLAPTLQGRGFFRNVRADVVPGGDVSPYLQPTYNASIDFHQPAFLQRPKDAFGIGTFAHRSINPGVFIDRGYGGQVTFTHQIATRAPASLNYRYELNRVEASDVYFCVNYGVCDAPTIGSLRSHQSLSPLALTAFVDRSDIPFSPTKGYVARLDMESASSLTASDYRYNRFFFDASAYGHRSRTKHVYSAHIRAGFVRALSTGTDNGVLHPRKRFYAGGANSVRGFAENQLGPRILTINNDTALLNAKTSLPGGTCALTIDAVKFCDPNAASLKNSDFIPQPLGGTSLLEGGVEYRFPLRLTESLRNFVGAVFIDGGIVGSGEIRGLQTVTNIVRGTSAITPGFGIRYQSPVGPIRVDFGINPNRAENLGVVTAVRDSTGQLRIVPLGVSKRYSQGKTLLNRLVLHFSIGEAY